MSNKVIKLKLVVAVGIPFFAALSGSLAPYALDGNVIPDSTIKRAILAIIVSSAAVGAALSGLGSFLSTSFSDHVKQQTQDAVNQAAGLPAGLPQVTPAPSTTVPAPVIVAMPVEPPKPTP